MEPGRNIQLHRDCCYKIYNTERNGRKYRRLTVVLLMASKIFHQKKRRDRGFEQAGKMDPLWTRQNGTGRIFSRGDDAEALRRRDTKSAASPGREAARCGKYSGGAAYRSPDSGTIPLRRSRRGVWGNGVQPHRIRRRRRLGAEGSSGGGSRHEWSWLRAIILGDRRTG